MKPIRSGVLIWAVCFALLLSAMNTAPAFADEAIPPADETTSSEEVVSETEATTSEEEEATPPDVSEVDSVADEESTTVAEVIESLPQDTTLVVVDENGEALPLASAEAQEIIYNGDPIWCPAGVAPNPGVGGCSPSFTGFTDDAPITDNGLIAWLYDTNNAATISKAGVIWVAYNYSTTELGNIQINGTLVAGTMETFALTVNGGWNGTAGSTALNSTTPYSTIVNPFSIVNWGGAVTLNNLNVSGASGASVTALEIITIGNVTLNNIDVVSNTTQYGGAYIEAGNVTVNDSTFNGNTGANAKGLEIFVTGTVTLKNVTANGNTRSGSTIDNVSATAPKAVTLNGTNQFNNNGENGVVIGTRGVITINNVIAMNNGTYGALIDNCSYSAGTCNLGVSNGVSVKGTNNFSHNGWDGLRVISGGAITVNNITANGNGTSPTRPAATIELGEDFDATGKGVFLLNVGASTSKNITISGTNTFNNNASNGLSALTLGMLTVNNITANVNGCDPLKDTDTSWCAGALLFGNSGVAQTGYGRFEGDDAAGLLVLINLGKGSITLNNLFALSNGMDGVYIEADGALATTPINVTINGENVFEENGNRGLFIVTDGTVTLNNLTAEGNGDDGVNIENNTYTKAVTLKGVNTFLGNGDHGLFIISYGAITTNAVTAFGNFGGGAYINNCVVDVLTCDALTAQPITMNGNNFFQSNGAFGLYILSRGAVTINNLNGSYNGAGGVDIFNGANNAVGGVTIKGYLTALENNSHGVNINSNGAVTLANVSAMYNNTGSGVVIVNDANAAIPVNVTITGKNNFSGNNQTGLSITTFGTVLLNNITANENTSFGAYIDSNGGSLAKSVTLNGNNTFNGNSLTGLYIGALGVIKVNNVMANNNLSYGAELDNQGFASINQPVTITGFGIFNNNVNPGLYVYSNGAVTFANITANNNAGDGVFVETQYNNLANTTYANVTLTGVNTFNNNIGDGLIIYTDGNITVSNITANDNASYGAYLDNFTYANTGATGIRTVNVTGTNIFNSNDNGLSVSSRGTVSLTRITANYNDDGAGNGTGLFVSTSEGAINLTCGAMYNNTDYGYNLNPGIGKVITLKGVYTYGNILGDYTNITPVITRTCPLP